MWLCSLESGVCQKLRQNRAKFVAIGLRTFSPYIIACIRVNSQEFLQMHLTIFAYCLIIRRRIFNIWQLSICVILVIIILKLHVHIYLSLKIRVRSLEWLVVTETKLSGNWHTVQGLWGRSHEPLPLGKLLVYIYIIGWVERRGRKIILNY